MKAITFYLDFSSPYAFLAFEALPQVLQGLSYSVDYRPMVLGALFKHHGHSSPAELKPKRAWIMRHVQWLAHQQGLNLQVPEPHPFHPVALLRLALACSPNGQPNRWVCETIFRHVWTAPSPGTDAMQPERVDALVQTLQPRQDPNSEPVKQQLRANTDAAIAAGAFGVPAMVVDGHLFWGLDALPMLRAYLEGEPWLLQQLSPAGLGASETIAASAD